jgi:hypothetical protein
MRRAAVDPEEPAFIFTNSESSEVVRPVQFTSIELAAFKSVLDKGAKDPKESGWVVTVHEQSRHAARAGDACPNKLASIKAQVRMSRIARYLTQRNGSRDASTALFITT